MKFKQHQIDRIYVDAKLNICVKDSFAILNLWIYHNIANLFKGIIGSEKVILKSCIYTYKYV